MDFSEFLFKRQNMLNETNMDLCCSKINSNKRQRLIDSNENEIHMMQRKETRKMFLHLEKCSSIYQTENPKNSKDGDTIYLPLSGDIFLNMERADEITFTEGPFFVGDENGQYSKTTTGTAMHIWRYSDLRQHMVVTRSFLITEQMVFNRIKDFLLSTRQ